MGMETVLESEEKIITIEQVKAFIESNKERPDVSEYVATFAVEKDLNTETVNAYLETPEGKFVLQPKLDRYATQAIKTHDEKQASVIEARIKAGVNEGIRKLHPEETEEQRLLREVTNNMEKMQKDMEAKELRNAILMTANDLNVPKELVENFPFPSVDHFKSAAGVFTKLKDDIAKKAINDFVASTAYKPQVPENKDNSKMTFSQFQKLPRAEQNRMAETGEIDNLVVG
jgi:hypothetical protein